MAERNFQLLNSAWNAALKSIDCSGEPTSDIEESIKAFLSRKACKGIPREEATRVFQQAIKVAKEATKYRRTKMPQHQPKPVRRYELLLELAQELQQTAPDADDFLIMAGCRLNEIFGDR